MKYTFQVLLENKLIFTFCIGQEFFSPETWTLQGVKLNFFFLIATWLLNSSKWQPIKKSWSPFSKTNKTFCYTVSVLDGPSKIKLGKRSLTCYIVDTRMDDIQCSGSSKSKMASSYRSRCMCYVLETNLTRKFAADLSLQIFLIHYISR